MVDERAPVGAMLFSIILAEYDHLLLILVSNRLSELQKINLMKILQFFFSWITWIT